jgi:hypothetical protein
MEHGSDFNHGCYQQIGLPRSAKPHGHEYPVTDAGDHPAPRGGAAARAARVICFTDGGFLPFPGLALAMNCGQDAADSISLR